MRRKGHCFVLKTNLNFDMFYKLIVCFAKTYFTLSAAHTNSCVLWLWHFLKRVSPHLPFMADA